jgi:hypothetical protein
MKTVSTRGAAPFAALIAALAVGALPAFALAADPTFDGAVKLSDTSALYTISYAFGDDTEDLYFPILGVRDLENDSRTHTFGYEMLEDGRIRTTDGTAAGLILSDAPIVGDLYKVSKGTVAHFTVVMLYTVPDSLHENDYALHVEDLPFYVGGDMRYEHLNPSELQYYQTPTVSLNDE